MNALIGLWARSKDVFYSMRTSDHEVDGRGCQYQQIFFLRSRPTASSSRTCPRKFLKDVEALARHRHRDCTPKYLVGGSEAPGERVQRAAIGGRAADGAARLDPRGRIPWPTAWEGKSLLLSGMPGTGKTHLAKRIVTQLSELGEGVVLISKTHCSVQNLGLGAQTADRWVRLLPGLAGRGGGHAARRRAVGRHRRALHEPPGEISQDLVHVARSRRALSRAAEDLAGRPNEALPPLPNKVELGHPSLQSLGVLRILVAHRDPGLVPLPAAGSSSRSARAPRFPATPSSPERAGRRDSFLSPRYLGWSRGSPSQKATAFAFRY